MALRARVAGCGAYLPRRVLTNAELAERVDTNDAWIAQRTGIRQRHIAGDGERTSQMATKAAEAALARAGLSPADIDLIVLATSTPDDTFPATATQVQAALGMTRGAAFDIQAVCTGFVYALAVADNFIRAGQARGVLVIGAETFSRILDWEDRGTCVLFGDGAGAMVLTAVPGDGTTAEACCRPISSPTGASAISSTSMAARPRPARSAISGCRGGRSSAMPSSRWRKRSTWRSPRIG